MSIIERAKATGVPLDQSVMIGSGLLDALGFREATDVDIVVTDELFATLKASGLYRYEQMGDDGRLTAEGVEVWRSWGDTSYDPETTFDKLAATALTIEGVKFAAPEIIAAKKRARGWEKDLRDITVLEEYYGRSL